MGEMRRRRLAWGLTLPLAAAGGLSAHAAAYTLVSSHHHSRSAAHTALMHWRVCVSACVALALVAALAHAVEMLRGGSRRRTALSVFAVLPPAGFLVQEQVEHALEHGALSHTLFVEPVFLVGLLLQIPFAAAAYLIARAVVTVAVNLIRALGLGGRPRLAPTAPRFRLVPEPVLAVANPIALGHGQRAPPLLFAA